MSSKICSRCSVITIKQSPNTKHITKIKKKKKNQKIIIKDLISNSFSLYLQVNLQKNEEEEDHKHLEKTANQIPSSHSMITTLQVDSDALLSSSSSSPLPSRMGRILVLPPGKVSPLGSKAPLPLPR